MLLIFSVGYHQPVLGDKRFMSITQVAWERWKVLGEAFGDFQGRLFAVLFYFTIFAPFALGVRLFSDPLHVRTPQTKWVEREPVSSTLDDARQQF
jgi:hypothetical protein